MNFMKEKRQSKSKWYYLCVIVLLCAFLFFCFSQSYFAHRKKQFVPDYQMIELTPDDNYDVIFLQTGLGKAAVDKLRETGNAELLLEVQKSFFSEDRVECVSVLGWFTKSDRVEKEDTAEFVDLQPGDILLSFSTHSIGWNHGHAGLVLDEQSVLECTSLGKNSQVKSIGHWRTYSNYMVLRVKDASKELRSRVAAFAEETLYDVPYRLSAGLFGEKATSPDDARFGLQCAYLVWYAWQEFGYDLDSDGGRLVTMQDILRSEYLEIVQLYGINPLEFY